MCTILMQNVAGEGLTVIRLEELGRGMKNLSRCASLTVLVSLC